MKKYLKGKRGITALAIVVGVVFITVLTSLASNRESKSDLVTTEKGTFEVTIASAGELFAEKYIDVPGPEMPANKVRGNYHGSSIPAYALKILDIIPEGTIVKRGDYVAQFDKTEYDNYLKGEIEESEEFRNRYEVSVLDSAVFLTNSRDEIKNQALAVEEAVLNLEKLQYEAPAIVRQAEKRLERARMYYEQRLRSYKLRQMWKGREVTYHRLNYESMLYKIENLKAYIEGFTIYAPSDGMLIYKKNRNGTKRTAGTVLNNYDLTVATIPDLTTMLSRTYISEIEISRISQGQKVKIRIDAFPGKEHTGVVRNIALIGEELKGSDTKMFEVITTIDGFDPALRPGMTTGNEIVTKTFEDVIHIPAECVYSTAGNRQVVYTKGRTIKEVITGETNGREVIISTGLREGEKVYLTPPENADKFTYVTR